MCMTRLAIITNRVVFSTADELATMKEYITSLVYLNWLMFILLSLVKKHGTRTCRFLAKMRIFSATTL